MVDVASTRSRRPGNTRSFACTFPDCGKVYTRSEHLTRHELNHRPKEIFSCSIKGCSRRFVRNDLRARHEERHRTGCLLPASPVSLVGNPRTEEFSFDGLEPSFGDTIAPTPGVTQVSMALQVPENGLVPVGMDIDHGFLDNSGEASSFIPSFGTWLFNAEDPANELDFSHLPFINFDNSFNPTSDFGSPNSRSFSVDKRSGAGEVYPADEYVGHARLQELSSLVRTFIAKEKLPLSTQLQSFIGVTGAGDAPYISAELVQACVNAFWEHISPQMPFLHFPTFSANTCHLLLLATLVMLGASTLHRLASSSAAGEYADFANLLARHIRWEIFVDPAASPPAELWSQQALLLLELFEKMFSSRELHERAHIHHASTLALLRRGNPLVGQSGSETPAIGKASGLDEHGGLGTAADILSAPPLTWWGRWARAEAQNRVVFAAYLLDCSHSIFFGQAAVLSPQEIQLSLPCDDILWHSPNAESLQRNERNLRMYGLKSISFLDGLKRAVHGEEVRTHAWARKILMYGLISVGYHISNREPLLAYFGSAQAAAEQERCRKLLSEAFDTWKTCFDEALSNSDTLTTTINKNGKPKRNFDDPHTIYFLANLSMNANIVDLQTVAGAARLSGRYVTAREKSIATGRAKEWAKSTSGSHAAWHAFKFLNTVLVVSQSEASSSSTPSDRVPYVCREDELNYRPWVVYLAALTIWAYVFAVDLNTTTRTTQADKTSSRENIADFLAFYAESPARLQQRPCLGSLLGLLEMLNLGFLDAQTHLQNEARDGLRRCCEMIKATTSEQDVEADSIT